MKICICTTPIRPEPTNFPPFGSMAIIQSLRTMGEDVYFYNIDYFRYPHNEVEAYYSEQQFDIVGISAVVSTAYSYTKYLADLIKKVSPNTAIIVGGNLAASAEILLRKCQVDFCVVGDGEYIIRELVGLLKEKPLSHDRLRGTRGICFLDENGQFEFTGYGARPSAEEVESPDYDILEADGSLPYFITEKIDARFYGGGRERRLGERAATVVMTKGCVARCTFCHRWEKGFRALPVERVLDHVQLLKERYNVVFVDVADENFGSDRKQAHALAEGLGRMGIAWRAAGVRARTVTREMLRHWKMNGCISVIYGVESGSQKMLNVMEKNTTVQQNIEAIKLAYETGLFTVVQLVLGMPGETDDTIRETAEFMKEVSRYLFVEGRLPSELMSVNYAQALPGTPLYEWARQHGFIGKHVDDEEEYLIRISDTDAYSTDHFINYTGQPLLKVLVWRYWMSAAIDAEHIHRTSGASLSLLQVFSHFMGLHIELLKRKHEVKVSRKIMPVRARTGELGTKEATQEQAEGRYDYYSQSGYFNIKPGARFAPLLLNPVSRWCCYPMLAVGVAFLKGGSVWGVIRLLAEHLIWSCTHYWRPADITPDRSLRKVTSIEPSTTGPSGKDLMIPLRLGR